MNIFFFPLENYVRELDGRCSIISELNKLEKYHNKNNKFISIILPKNIMYLIHKFIFSSYSVLGMSLRKSMYGYAKKINKSKGSYYFLEEEYFDRFSDNSIRFGAQDQCKHAFASTKKDYESLKRKFTNRITFCGNPRIDVLNKIENLYKNEILMLRNKYGRFFLFNSTFSFLNPPKGLDYKFLSNIGIFRSEKEKKDLIEYLENHKQRGLKVREKLLDKKFSSNFDNLIYRPHPNESLDKARKMFESTSVIVEASGNALVWIAAAESIGHSGCTTAIEGFLMSKDAKFFYPFEKDKEFLSYKVSKSYINHNNKEITIDKNLSLKSVISELPDKQAQKEDGFASSQIARIMDKDSNDSSLTLLILGILISLIVNIKGILYTYLKDEKETIRRNSDINKAARRFKFKKFISLKKLGILVVYN